MKVPNKLQLSQNSELETKHLKVSWREVKVLIMNTEITVNNFQIVRITQSVMDIKHLKCLSALTCIAT